eukprot:CAMPEP_0113727390 /NCGR_PEP_ID=MMETSP0038_2-20120614/41069_1 /TAXON_ID=2898 /ORGANISM="Cryptomonas paramecium" /LENGTH=326 /DNA_ID=CAMNT_0000658319 /DNA_START=201 /DNA_END=1181 /DNA_ORIENTATION=- /assembly_acc=CAM_ASM_000170
MSRRHLFSALNSDHRRFEVLFPYIQSHYGHHGELRVFLRGETHIVSSQAGVHQGDPFGSTLFALGLHPLLCAVADSFVDTLILAYADNVFMVGDLEPALHAAAAFKAKLPSAALQLNDKESTLWCLPDQLQSLPPNISVREGAISINDLCLPVAHDGLQALGCPIGLAAFGEVFASRLVADIQQELDNMLPFPHQHHRAKILTFGTNSRFTYYARCWPVKLLQPVASQVDAIVDSFVSSALPFWQNPATYSQSLTRELAIRQIRLNLAYGGWGLRSHRDHLPAAHIFPVPHAGVGNPSDSSQPCLWRLGAAFAQGPLASCCLFFNF